MKLVGVREAQQQLSGLVSASQRERVVLTRHGKPVAVLTGVEGQDLEEVILTRSPVFRKLIEDRRRHSGPFVSHEELRARAQRGLARKPRGKKEGKP